MVNIIIMVNIIMGRRGHSLTIGIAFHNIGLARSCTMANNFLSLAATIETLSCS